MFGSCQVHGQAHVTGTHQHRACLRQLGQVFDEFPVPEGAGVVIAQAKHLNGDALCLGRSDKIQNLRVRYALDVELD